jgi:hypothetical protein
MYQVTAQPDDAEILLLGCENSSPVYRRESCTSISLGRENIVLPREHGGWEP